ncbi:MAG: amino acid adenylation domain-containing protein, partial [Candidatus Bipolaricaulia bacterium]
MSDISRRISELPPEKRKLFELLLREQGVDVGRSFIVPRSRESDTFPLSFGQERLWFLDQLDPSHPVYNESGAIRLQGSVNLAALEQSLNEIVRRHEVLRTTFATVDGQPVQVIAPALTLSLPVVDLRELPEAEQEAEVRRRVTEEAQRPFDLARGPLMRVTLLRLGKRDHVLLLTIHHIVCDGWSIGILVRELAMLYKAFSTGNPSPLPELPIQYADFAHWQREWLQGEVLESQLSYWKQQLGDDPPVLQLPTDRPRPPVQTFRGATQFFELPKALYESLKALSRREDVTLFMTLLAVFQALLSRYSGQEDIIVGTPIAGRTRAELEALIGFFVNTLVLRSDLSGDPSFRELLGRVRNVTLNAYAHQDLPFEKLVEELQPERSLSHTPLFQVMFQLYNAQMSTLEVDTGTTVLELNPFQLYNVQMPALEAPEVTLSSLEADTGTTVSDLNLLMVEEAQGLRGWIEYSTDLFDGATIERMLGHFQTLLEGVVADPDRRLSDFPLLTETEQHQLLLEWNDTQADYPQDSCLHQLFEAQVEKTPDAVAVVFEDEQLTYQALNDRANQLAHHLQSMGVGPEVRVGMFMDRSLEMVIGLLGILKAGGAHVPLDPAYPKERLAFMLQDANVPVLLTQQQLLERLPEHSAEVICLDTDWQTIAQQSADNPTSDTTPNHLAYVIYTSGSTGTPKGVMIPHRGICNRLHWMQSAYRLTETDRVLQKTPFSFDVSVWEFFWPLLTGARLVVARPDGHRDNAYLVQLMAEQQITTLHFVPSMLQLFVEEPELEVGYSLKRVICSGEALPIGLQERSFARLDAETELHNLYGPTEASIDVTCWACERDSQLRTVPIGRPIDNTQIYILDAHLQPVPISVPGELYIGGVSLARGYHGRPALTGERFIPDPFSDEPGARLYKTGDLARYRPDGNIEFLGRNDDQVKIRGFRIEPGEIEAVLGEHPAVHEVVVLAREDAPGNRRLVAYLVVDQEPAPSTTELRRFLQQKLPEYMVPSAFVVLDALPLTPNGKVDRRALPAPDPTRPELERTFNAPRTSIEERVAGIWTELLGVEQVGVYDNFFELGGHSLLATQVISRVRDTFQVELPLRRLFELPTVAGLAESIEATRLTGQGLNVPPIRPVPREKYLPLSFAQERLWFLDQLMPDSP